MLCSHSAVIGAHKGCAVTTPRSQLHHINLHIEMKMELQESAICSDTFCGNTAMGKSAVDLSQSLWNRLLLQLVAVLLRSAGLEVAWSWTPAPPTSHPNPYTLKRFSLSSFSLSVRGLLHYTVLYLTDSNNVCGLIVWVSIKLPCDDEWKSVMYMNCYSFNCFILNDKR